jgi:CRP-like cAMP-binding protein
MPRGPDVSVIVEQVKTRLKQIEDQFGQHRRLVDELERLRAVLRDLERLVTSRLGDGRAPAPKPAERAGASPAAKPAARATGSPAAKPAPVPARTPRGQNKAKILAALKGRGPMTASEIAKVTDIPTATVSTTLTKMAKAGELRKAERGYTLP